MHNWLVESTLFSLQDTLTDRLVDYSAQSDSDRSSLQSTLSHFTNCTFNPALNAAFDRLSHYILLNWYYEFGGSSHYPEFRSETSWCNIQPISSLTLRINIIPLLQYRKKSSSVMADAEHLMHAFLPSRLKRCNML